MRLSLFAFLDEPGGELALSRIRAGQRRGTVGHESKNPYYEDQKFPEPTCCTRCGLVYRNGRWQQGEGDPPAANVQRGQCPACRREVDRYPGGLLHLRGTYLTAHREEILNLARNQASAAAAQRPLQRIMSIEEDNGSLEIATTSSHLALRIGKAIVGACKGELTIKHASEDVLVRVYWERDEPD